MDIRSIVEARLGAGRPAGDNWLSFRCPFHKEGQELRPSFAVHLQSGGFHCFACHESGGLPRLLQLLGLTTVEIDSELQEIREDLRDRARKRKWMDDHRGISKDPFWAPIILPEKILTPYRAVVPEKLLRLGFSETWLRALEIGTDFHNHRIIYPVRDLYGHLAGCVGGIRYPGQYPKYKPYEGSRTLSDGTTRESEYGTWFDEEFPDYHFAHHRYLWNFDRAYPSLFFAPAGRFLVLTEGFKACLWTLQSGVPLVSALMGSAVTEEQHQLLLRISTPIIFFLDNNEAGIQATLKYGAELFFTRGEVYVARYTDQREQPDNLTGSEVLRAVYEPEHFLAFSERRSRSVADRASILTPNNMRQI